MTLNKEDFAILQENVHQIENYLRSLMPGIQENITVGFGDMVRRDAGYGLCKPEIEYNLFLRKDMLLGGSGCLRYEFVPNKETSTGCVSVYSRGHGEEFMQKLVLNWPKIKEKIQVIIGAQQNKLDKIRNFTL